MDNKDQKDGRDRDRIAGNEEYEVRYAAEQMGVSEDEVREAIEKVGNMREDVENYLKGRDNK